MKILFFGTPGIAAHYLEELIADEEVVGVITQPDKPAHRGHKIQSSPVKACAEKNNISLFQPDRVTQSDNDAIGKLNADIGVVISYGKLIPESVFTLPKLGCFNIHFSLLPKYRGAAPIQWALINGEKETGVSTFWLERTLDSGPVLIQKTLPVSPQDDYASLLEKLIPLGLSALRETLVLLKKGKATGSAQDGAPTFAPSLKKEDGRIYWNKPAQEIYNRIRGTVRWPGAFAAIAHGALKGKTIKILKASLHPAAQQPAREAGSIAEVIKDAGFVIACAEGALLVHEVHPENKNPMHALDFLRGSHYAPGDRLF